MTTDAAIQTTAPSDQTELSPLTGRLSRTLQAGLIPRQYTDWSRRLLTRLQRPVQVVVIGLPGSGKSALIDMLLGRQILGPGPSAGMIEISYGTAPRAEIERADGSLHHCEGYLSAQPQATEAAAALRIRQELPDARLHGLSLTEIALFGAPARQAAIMQQAVAYADILLFCSDAFTPPEQALWAQVPDAQKDHSFLVLTMADRRIMRGTLGADIAALEAVAAQDFLGLYPLAAIQGLTAQVGQRAGSDTDHGRGPGVDRQLWHSSGGKRLYDDLMHQIDLGRTTDLDQVEMLLRQFALPETPQATAPSRGQQPQRQPHATPAEARPPAPMPARDEDLLSEAAAMIRDQAQRLMTDCAPQGTPDLNCIFDGTLATLREVLSSLQPHADRSDRLRAASEATRDGEELVMLCQLEQNEEAAVDAVTVLLQLRREMTPD